MSCTRGLKESDTGSSTQRWRSLAKVEKGRAGAGVQASAGKKMCGITVDCGVVRGAAATVLVLVLGNKFVETIGSNSLYGVPLGIDYEAS